MSSLGFTVRQQVKKAAYSMGFWGTEYPYYCSPLHLASFVNALEDLKDVPGCFVEIGVARGMTTRFVAEHIRLMNLDVPYYAIDTFSSFADDDLEYEVKNRNKNLWEMKVFWNTYEKFVKDFKEFEFLTVIKSDIKKVDFAELPLVKAAYLDVDLYQPTKVGLEKIYDRLVPNGYLFVDDVQDNNKWDGAYQAYMEFCNEKGLTPNVISSDCGVIRKPPAT